MSPETTARRWRRAPARAVLGVLRGYRTLISPSRPPACRFTPTCSAYAITAIERFGLVRGGWLALRRLSRCHPFHRGGHDPVPPLVRPAGRTDHASPVSRRLSHPAA